MQIEFAPAEAKFLKEVVQDGLFRTEAEVVRDAVRRVREAHESRQTRLIESLQRGEESLASGSGIPYGPTFIEESIERARVLATRGFQPDPGVLP